MRRITAAIFALLTIIPLCSFGRTIEDLNFGWLFHAGDIEGAESVSFDDSGWQTINVPHDFQISQPWVAPSNDEKADNSDAGANVKSRLSSRGFKEMGIGWYRKTITPDLSLKGKRVLLDFEGIMFVGDVYLNGSLIGGTDYGYLGFEIDVTSLLKYGEENIIAVKANTMNPDNSRWYTGGGLFRNVKLVATDRQLYFNRHPLYITTSDISDSKATVKVQAEITCLPKVGAIKVKTTISDPNGNVVSDKTNDIKYYRTQKTREYLVDSISVENPMLWSCDNPNLYTAEVAILNEDGSEADKVSSTFGIRSIEFSPEFGLKLNGEKVLLKGMANHHTLGALGAAAYPRAIEKRFQLLKEFGFNSIRTSHNPYSEDFLNLCDKYGFLVVDELYDKWLTKFAGGRVEWTSQWQKDVPEFIKRDRNHPSIVMWSLGNELQQYWELPYADWGVTPYKLQKTLLLRYDDTRPVTVAMHPRYRNQDTDSIPAPLALATDVASYNYRYMYFPGDSKRFPNMMFYQSEANFSGVGTNFFEMDLDKVIGLAYWGTIDYLGESGGWPAKGWSQGGFYIDLEPKPVAYLLKSMFKPDEPIVHIGVKDKGENVVWNDVQVGTDKISESWSRKEGSKLSLVIYTNADEVELLLNGKSLGTKTNNKNNPKERNRIKWDDVAYEQGTIVAIAKNSGKEVARHALETTGEAVSLKAEPDRAAGEWKADGTDLLHVRLSAVDKKGRQVYEADGNVEFAVEGPAEIVGVINGDMTSNELSVGKSRHLFNGTCTVILRSSKETGKVKLTATSEGLKKATMEYVLQ